MAVLAEFHALDGVVVDFEDIPTSQHGRLRSEGWEPIDGARAETMRADLEEIAEVVAYENAVAVDADNEVKRLNALWDESCLLYTSPSPRDATLSRMPSSA